MGDAFPLGDGAYRRRQGPRNADLDALVEKYSIKTSKEASCRAFSLFLPDFSPFALVWAVTLAFLRLISRVHAAWKSWWAVVRHKWRRRKQGESSLSGLIQFSAACKDGRCRVPEHLAVVVQDSEPENQNWLSQVAEVVVWCVVVGVPAVTVYDTAGVLKRAQEKLAEQLVAIQESLLGAEFTRFRVTSKSVRIDYGYTNGKKVDHWMNLSIVGPNDCKPAMVDAVRRLADVVRTEPGRFSFSPESRRGLSKYPEKSILTAVSAEEFEKELSKTRKEDEVADASGVPARAQPDMMINIGRVQTTAGFMPWHIGFTSIFLVPSLPALTEDSFLDLLRQFSGCEQRFGK